MRSVTRGSRCAALALFLFAAPTLAGSHLWKISEVFSNADGTVQFIELNESGGSTFETALGGKTMTDQVNGSVFTIPSNIVGNTADRYLLFATAAFAALPGAPTPDYIIPAHFFAINGDTIHWAPAFFYDNFTYGAGALPTNGTSSIQVTNYNTHTFITAVNSPTNFAGQTGSVVATNVPALSTYGIALAATLLAAAGIFVLRKRACIH